MADVVQPRIGMKFTSFKQFEEYLMSYSSQEKQVFTVRNSSSIENSTRHEGVNLDLKYVFATFACKFFGEPRTATSGERQSFSYKKGCGAHIKIKLSKTKADLEISKLSLVHENHAESVVFYKAIPENRRLSPASTAEIEDLIKYDANRKLIKNKLGTEKKKFVTYKDLANIRSRMYSRDDNELSSFIKKLQDNGCNVMILRNENSEFKGVYFSTADMRNSMKSWPQIVFIDGTHKLFNRNFTLIILLVQDSNGRGEIVGAAVITSEDRETMKWIAEMFKKENPEACEKIRCFMGDKDMTERNVLKEVFPGIPIYLCLFHTLRSFARALNKKKMQLSNETHDECIGLLQQLAYSSSEEAYQATFNDLKNKVPATVYSYFVTNWHDIRHEWTWYSMIQGNLNNLTNNRLESYNKQIKQVVNLHSSLCHFADRFFQFIQSYNQETDMKTARQFLKRPITVFTSDTAEQDYSLYLVEKAFLEVQRELRLHHAVSIERCNETNKSCTIKFLQQQIEASPTECQCRFRSSMSLPCKHIFAVRERFKMPLFDESICGPIWTKQYTKTNQRAFRDAEFHDEDVVAPTDVVFHKICQKNYRTIGEKRRALNSIMEELVDVASTSVGLSFQTKIVALKTLTSAWRDGSEVHIDVVRTKAVADDNGNNTIAVSQQEALDEPGNLDSEMNALSITDSTTVTLSNTTMPSRVRTRGRPKGVDSTTTKFYPRKIAPQTFSSMSANEQRSLLISWLVSDDFAADTLSKSGKIDKRCVENHTAFTLRDSFANRNVDITILLDYLEMDSFNHLQRIIEQKRSNGVWMCAACNLQIKNKSEECGASLAIPATSKST